MEHDLDAVALSELQLDLMRVLWRGEASVADVAAALAQSRGLAHTTVATLLTRLAKRGIVAQRRDGRMTEGRIGVVDHRPELVGRNFAAGETMENLEGDVLIGLAAQVADFLLRHGRPFARHV